VVLRYLMTRTWTTVGCLFVAVLAATFDYFVGGKGDVPHCTTTLQGANIELACLIVGCSGAFALLTTLVLAKDLGQAKYRRDVAVLLFIEAALLTAAVGFLLADSATYVVRNSGAYGCYVDRPGTEVIHVYGLLAVSIVALLLALLRAFGAWTGVEPPSGKPRRRSNWAVPSPS
jgi:hypothetical protein